MEYFLRAFFLLGLLGLLFYFVMWVVAWFKTRSEPGDYGYFYATWSALIRNHPFYKWRYVRWVLVVLLFIVCNEIILLFTFPETYPYATDPAILVP